LDAGGLKANPEKHKSGNLSFITQVGDAGNRKAMFNSEEVQRRGRFAAR
jgi:hypothetical protein